MDVIANGDTTSKIMDFPGVIAFHEESTDDVAAVFKLLDKVEENKEYILSSSEHSAIITRAGKNILCLDLQQGGIPEVSRITEEALETRFSCERNREEEYASILLDVDSLIASPDFRNLIRYINTKE